MKKETILKSRIEDAFGNKVLYSMCKNNPLHINNDIISGKVWLIGRAYAASIERVRNKKYKYISDDFYNEIVPKIFNQYYNDFDRDIRNIKKGEINTILSVHKKLTDSIKKVTDLENRSFSSKYLHFHCPDIFYIYDSRASDSIHKIIKQDNKLYSEFKNMRKGLSGEFDINYAEFFIKCIILKKNIKEKFGIELSTREIDNYLIITANIQLRMKNIN